MDVRQLKSTGVIRRIDDLGRIVIPKEIRRNLKIRDGENMEIFVDIDSIILKKYSKLDDVLTTTEKLSKIINDVTNYDVIITDRDHVISSYGEVFKNLKNENLSQELIDLIDNRNSINAEEKKELQITNKEKIEGYFYITPIISTADSIGLIILYSIQPLKDEVKIISKLVSNLICEQVDIN